MTEIKGNLMFPSFLVLAFSIFVWKYILQINLPTSLAHACVPDA
jgi:hypothetical protein